MMEVELRHSDQRAVVVQTGATLRAYSAAGRELLDGFGAGEISSSGRGQALIPWPNRLRDGRYEFAGRQYQLPLSEPTQHNAIHGLVRWQGWTVAERDQTAVTMEHMLHPREGYPFGLSLALTYALDDGGLSVRLRATNVGDDPCPFGAGAHPYLTAGTETIDPCTLRAPGAVWMTTDERQIPTGREPVGGSDKDFREAREVGATQLDTGYADLMRDADGLARVVLTAPDGETGATLWQDESYPYLMLFTGDALPDAGRRRRGLGVEPMTCAPNALATGEGLRTLAPGETFEGAWGISPLAP
ncbi:MAG: aldose 1-epimerase family protein [Solirubrobacteraceae bacterium]